MFQEEKPSSPLVDYCPQPFDVPKIHTLQPRDFSTLSLGKRPELLLTGGEYHCLHSLAINLQHMDYVAIAEPAVRRCLTMLESGWQPDVLMIDSQYDAADGLAIWETLRAHWHGPSVFLVNTNDRASSLDLYAAGADLVIHYPREFSLFEAQIFGCLRRLPNRSERALTDQGAFEMDLTERELLMALLQGRQEPVATDDLVAAVWPDEAVNQRTRRRLRVYIHRLRQTLARLEPEQDYLQTVRGRGYALVGVPRVLRAGLDDVVDDH